MMKWKYWVVYLLFFIFIFNNLYSQVLSYSDTISWEPVEKVFIGKEKQKYVMKFKNGQFASPHSFLPHYVKRFAVQLNVNSIQARLIVHDFDVMDNETVRLLNINKEFVKNEFEFDFSIFKERKIPFVHFMIYPLRRGINGEFEVIKSFSIEYTLREEKRGGNREYVQNSVLNSGTWYRFSVRSTGIARITYQDLKNMGIEPENVNPSMISVFGNGGHVLPESNSSFRYDDLQEVAIEVIGGSDGTFDVNDYIIFYARGSVGWLYDEGLQMFKHVENPYSDVANYFISVDPSIGIKKRVSAKSSISETPNFSFNSYTDYAVYEKDAVNLTKSGRNWLGELFDMNLNYNFPFRFNGIILSSPAKLYVRLAAAASQNSSFSITVGSQSFSL